MDKNIQIKLSATTLQLSDCQAFVRSDDCGAICTFVGTVRNQAKGVAVVKLEFEAYEPMAIKEMKKIAQQAQSKYDIRKVSLHHRVGTLGVGEIPVIIAISSPHRKAAFAACAFVIDTLKKTVPIWKKEYAENGAYWVSPTP